MIRLPAGKYTCPSCRGIGYKSYHGGGIHNEDGIGDKALLSTYGELLSMPSTKMQLRAYSERIGQLAKRVSEGAKMPRRFSPSMELSSGDATDSRMNKAFRERQLSRNGRSE